MEEDAGTISEIKSKLDRLNKNQIKYEHLHEELIASGEPQISTTDLIVEVC